MATVGNLFVNIRGNTSGLERSLSKARKKIDFFKAWSDRKSAATDVEKFRGRANDIMKDALGSIFARESPGFKKAEMGYGRANKALDAAKMRMFMSAGFATLGVSAAAVGYLLREGSKIQKTTEEDFATYTAAGAMGRVRQLLDRIAYVQRPDVQRDQSLIQQTEREQLQREREVFGPTGAGARQFGIDMREMGSTITGALLGRDQNLSGGF